MKNILKLSVHSQSSQVLLHIKALNYVLQEKTGLSVKVQHSKYTQTKCFHKSDLYKIFWLNKQHRRTVPRLYCISDDNSCLSIIRGNKTLGVLQLELIAQKTYFKNQVMAPNPQRRLQFYSRPFQPHINTECFTNAKINSRWLKRKQ